MSEPVELAFREQLAARFSVELGGRVYDLVSPPEAALPLATYQRVGGDGTRARIQVVLRAESYRDVKRLQKTIEDYFRKFRGELGQETCVWAYQVRATTLADRFMGPTRHRLAVSEFEILHAR